jgi:CRP/FNR family transcriptional regulator, cyclic AMP receptor protein
MSRAAESNMAFEDPLALLPRKPVLQYARKRVIYDPQRQVDNLFVVVSGRVKVSQAASDGIETIVRIVSSDGIFGESALLGPQARFETATALDAVRVMSWSAAEIESHIQREPRLGTALVQYMIRQCIQMEDRIQCMAICKTPERVAMALVQLAESSGTPLEDGALRMGGMTHHTLAEYVGTSREIVTFQLNRLRRLGMVKYTRKNIDVYWQAILEQLRTRKTPIPVLSEKRESAAASR